MGRWCDGQRDRLSKYGSPKGNRTPISTVRGWRPNR